MQLEKWNHSKLDIRDECTKNRLSKVGTIFVLKIRYLHGIAQQCTKNKNSEWPVNTENPNNSKLQRNL